MLAGDGDRAVRVGTYRAEFDHLQELTGRLADQVIEAHAEEREGS